MTSVKHGIRKIKLVEIFRKRRIYLVAALYKVNCLIVYYQQSLNFEEVIFFFRKIIRLLIQPSLYCNLGRGS